MQPLRFQPIMKRIRWGGRRLETMLKKQLGPEPDYAESWELVDHWNDQSVVESSGEHHGATLQQLVRNYSAEIFNTQSPVEQFPLLFKFLDANDRLSVQVHPNDQQAKQFDPTENGKTEAWYIIDAAPESVMYVGLKPGVHREEFETAIRTGCFEKYLNVVYPKPGDCFFIPAGTVHAIGEGVLLAEIQQSSDLTFRVFDWNRVDRDGKPRDLHVEQALECIDFDQHEVHQSHPKTLTESEFHRIEEQVDCEFFRVRSYHVHGPITVPEAAHCRVWMCLQGQGALKDGSFQASIQLGETLLIPAISGDIHVEPQSDEELILLETDVILPAQTK